MNNDRRVLEIFKFVKIAHVLTNVVFQMNKKIKMEPLRHREILMDLEGWRVMFYHGAVVFY